MEKDFRVEDICHINNNSEYDTFVGIKGTDGVIRISFPLGFSLGNSSKSIRKDILTLFKVLAYFTEKKDSEFVKTSNLVEREENFPVQAYMKIISDYLQRGYYTDNEVKYSSQKRGKINWNRTIKTQTPYPEMGGFFYLTFSVKNNSIKQDELITLIHEYCVYESFEKLGWLFTSSITKKPRIKFSKTLFLSVIRENLMQTFNDKNIELFHNMIDIINSLDNIGHKKNFRFGTDKFEYVWEKMIDQVFGVGDKDRYFPRSTWHLIEDKNKDNCSLEPDTIMLANGNIYVLDAKYYRYGLTLNPGHLPSTASINKQITYGEYIYRNIDRITGNGNKVEIEAEVFNAFIMPFNNYSGYFNTKNNLKYIGNATGDWRVSDSEYEFVQGILLDVKSIMYRHIRQDKNEINILAKLIEENSIKYEKTRISGREEVRYNLKKANKRVTYL